MTPRPVLTPHAGHPITIAPNPKRVVIWAGEHVIADTRDALTLREAHYPAVEYIPRKALKMDLLRRSAYVSYCPYKGEANYFDIPSMGDRGTNAIWTYERPHDAVAVIKGHVAFYPDRVTIVRE